MLLKLLFNFFLSKMITEKLCNTRYMLYVILKGTLKIQEKINSFMFWVLFYLVITGNA